MIGVCNELYKEKEYEFYVAKAEETMIPREKYDIVTAAWHNDIYLQKFPKPPRQENIWQQSDFMMIQSNVNVQIERGQEAEEEVRSWMYETLSPVFQGEIKTLIFTGYNWYIIKLA